MPIYAYKCSSCGHAKDVLQKMSADPLTVCPECGAATFTKQVTAAGFQLKGSGWYVTDFRGGNNKSGAAPSDDAAGGESSSPDAGKAEGAAEAPAGAAAASTAAPSPAPAAAPASGTASGGSSTS